MNHFFAVRTWMFWAYMSYLLLFPWCFLPSSQYLCFHHWRLWESPPLSRRHTPLLALCHVFVLFFFSCFSHLCSCHVLVPVHQWASVLSTRSPWPKMSEQAAARQVHCAAGLCFTSSHPCTSCSVMLTVIESKQATASEADGKGLCFLETWIPAVWTSTALLWSWLLSGVLGVSWREVLCCALRAASKTLLCWGPLDWEAIWSLYMSCFVHQEVSRDKICVHINQLVSQWVLEIFSLLYAFYRSVSAL